MGCRWLVKGTRYKLTEKMVAKLSTTAGQAECFDALLPGLLLRVSSTGTKTFVVRVQRDGTRSRQALGQWPALTLVAAREKASAAIRAAASGERRVAHSSSTWGELLDAFIAQELPRLAQRTRDEWQRLIEVEIGPAMKLDLTDTRGSRQVVREALDRIAKTRPVLGNRVWSLTRRVVSWGIGRDLVDPAAGAIAVKLSKPAKEKPQRGLYSIEEVSRLLAAIKLEPALSRAFWLLAFFTAQRGEEIRTVAREAVDLQAGTWNFKVKGGKTHDLPLPRQAVALLRLQAAISRGAYLLEGDGPGTAWNGV